MGHAANFREQLSSDGPVQYQTRVRDSLLPTTGPYAPPLSRVAAIFRVFDGFLLIIDHDFGRAAAGAQGTPELLPPVPKAAGPRSCGSLPRLSTLG